MRKRLIVLLAAVGFVVTGIFVVAPRATTIIYEVSGIDLPGLTKQAKDLPEQHFDTH